MAITRYSTLTIILLSLLFFSSCKTHKIATGSAKSIKADTAIVDAQTAHLLEKINANRIPYETFSTRIRVEYSDGQMSQDFTAVVRMRRDSVLWLSMQGPFGIESARILITRDTLRMINKLGNEYVTQPISDLASMLPIQADMPMLQDFILGYYLQMSGAAPQYRGMEDSLYLIQSESPQMRYRARIYPQNYTLAKTLLTDKMAGQEMSITFDGYTAESGHPFSAERKIELRQGSKVITLHLSYGKVKINEPLVFPFEVDKGMKRIDRIRF